MTNRRKDKDTPKRCAKCGTKVGLEFHHFLPAAKWYWKREGVYLCHDCHKDWHRHAGRSYERKYLKPKSWYYITFIKWLILAFIVYLILT